MEGGVEAGEVRHRWQEAPADIDGLETRSLMQRRKVGEFGEFRAHRIVDDYWLGPFATVDDSVGDGVDSCPSIEVVNRRVQ